MQRKQYGAGSIEPKKRTNNGAQLYRGFERLRRCTTEFHEQPRGHCRTSRIAPRESGLIGRDELVPSSGNQGRIPHGFSALWQVVD